MLFLLMQVEKKIVESLAIMLNEPALIAPDELFHEKLADYINHLVNHDFNRLISLLYRMDVNEKKLREILSDNPAANAGTVIANLMIERQAEKIKSREAFRQRDENIGDEEKW
jgi:hypothetical protein